ncbi:hypothetical protein ACJX0J_021858 [Zea mays]
MSKSHLFGLTFLYFFDSGGISCTVTNNKAVNLQMKFLVLYYLQKVNNIWREPHKNIARYTWIVPFLYDIFFRIESICDEGSSSLFTVVFHIWLQNMYSKTGLFWNLIVNLQKALFVHVVNI